MEAYRTLGAHRKPAVIDDDHPPDQRALAVLRRYSDGELSPREAARAIGDDATEHDVYAGILLARLPLPVPPAAELRKQIEAAKAMLSRYAKRLDQ